ncbi:MAG: hypothetical protein V5A33_00615, partial [Halobacteriales archaeon]
MTGKRTPNVLGRADRGVAVQVGAVVLLGFVVASMAIYQATVVPAQNQSAEFEHNQQVHDSLDSVRDTLTRLPERRSPRSVSVPLGPRYRDRDVFVNPSAPAGTLRTNGTADPSVNVSIANATAVGNAETADFWSGNRTRNFSTGSLVYEPGYNEFRGPTTVYEHSVLFDEYADRDVVRSGQVLVDGDRISIVTLNGTFQRTAADAATLDIRPASSSDNQVALVNETGNLTISFRTRLSEDKWRQLLADELDGTGDRDNDARIHDLRWQDAPGPWHTVTLEFERANASDPYQLRMARANVGTGATDTEPAYVTRVDGGETITVREGSSTQLVAEVRDKFNNPVSGVAVSANDPGVGTLDPQRAV